MSGVLSEQWVQVWKALRVGLCLLAGTVSLVGCMSAIVASCRLLPSNTSASNVLRTVTSLSVAALINVYGLAVMASSDLIPTWLDTNHYVCIIMTCSSVLVLSVSLISHVLALADRYVALSHSIRYPHLINACRVNAVILLSWALAALLTALPLVYDWTSVGDVWSTCHQLLPFLPPHRLVVLILFASCFILILSLLIAVSYELHQKRVLLGLYRKRKHSTKTRYVERRQCDIRNASTVLLASGLFCVFWAPLVGLTAYHMFFSPSHLTNFINEVCVVVALCHASVYPFVWFGCLCGLRRACLPPHCCRAADSATSENPFILEMDVAGSNTGSLDTVACELPPSGSMLNLCTTLSGRDPKLHQMGQGRSSQPGPSQPGPSQPGPSQPGPSQPGPSQGDLNQVCPSKAGCKHDCLDAHRPNEASPTQAGRRQGCHSPLTPCPNYPSPASSLLFAYDKSAIGSDSTKIHNLFDKNNMLHRCHSC